jgi:CheY-like chemotaxis protein
MTTQQPCSVLVVEDDRDARDLLIYVLEDKGYAAAGAAHGREALGWLRASERPPCLILLDLMMPVMDGWQFRREQQRDPGLCAIPVLVVSAAAGLSQEAAALGAAGCVTKPVDVDHLMNLVRRHC